MSVSLRREAPMGSSERPEANVVDLRQHVTGRHHGGQQWGRPGPCPACGGAGYLDRIDMIERVMHQHCTECGHPWTFTEAQLLSKS